MKMDVDNKVVVVTGGASGIGFSIVKHFLNKNPKVVVILDKNAVLGKEALNKLSSDKAIFLQLDICNSNQVDEVFNEIFRKYETIDVLINNAGIVNDTNPKKTIEINLGAMIEISYKVWNEIRKNKGGKGGTIINIASNYGFISDGFVPSYLASKHGVIGFTKALGHEYNFEKSGVRVVALCPGFTRNTAMGASGETFCQNEYQRDFQKYMSEFPWQEPEAVGKAAVEIYEKAESGSAWIAEGGKSIAKVTSTFSY